MKVSVAIPVYEMHGKGVEYLKYCLQSVFGQTYLPYEIVVSDHSESYDIFNLCKSYSNNLIYYRNNKGRGSLANNLNSCMKICTGDIIKFIMQDDYLFNKESLAKIVSSFDSNKGWLASSYYHTENRKELFNLHVPTISKDMLFINRIGTPTCLTIKNGTDIWFDEELNWYVDSNFYTQLYKKYGEPVILKEPTAVQLLWEGQTTHIIDDDIIKKEELYLMKKYGAYRNG